MPLQWSFQAALGKILLEDRPNVGVKINAMNKKALAKLVEYHDNAFTEYATWADSILADVMPEFQDSNWWSLSQVEEACWKAIKYLEKLIWDTHPEQTGMFLDAEILDVYPNTYISRVKILATRYLEGKDDLKY